MGLIKKIVKLYKILFTKQSIPEIDQFIKINSKYWKEIERNKKEYILIEGFLQVPTYLMQSGRIAKAIEEEKQYTSIVFIDNYIDKLTNQTRLYRSFNIDKFIYYRRYIFKLKYILKAFIISIKQFLKIKNGEDLLNLEYDGLIIGDLIYDTILRDCKGVYTIDKLDVRYFKNIYDAYFRAHVYSDIFSKYDIKYLVISHVAYNKFGILARIADSKGTNVILPSLNKIKNYKYFNITTHQFTPLKSDIDKIKKEKKDIIKEVDGYLEKRFKGNINQHDVINAFKDKKIYSKLELIKKLGIYNENPIVYVMPHVFSDAPHCSEYVLFKDYYVWFVETMKRLQNNKEVNWVIKPHPSSHMYGEMAVVEDIFNKYRSENMYLMPKDFSTSSIKDIADAIVTVQGTAGLEFSCFGIPTIIAGKAFYSGYGFTIEPKTKEAYFELLMDIGKLKKLKKEQMDEAKALMAWIKIYSEIHSEIIPKRMILPGDNIEERYKENLSEISRNLLLFDPKDNYYGKAKELIK